MELAGIAAAAGIGWGVVMALLAWVRDGAEIVLLQGWILAAAWGFGRLAGRPGAGALAGFAVVAFSIWTYEVLPGWGLESAARRQGASPAELEIFVREFDADDIVLLWTMAIGALVGLGGSLRPRVAPEAPVPEQPPQTVDRPPPAPLWAGFGAPQAPVAEVAPPPPSPPVLRPVREGTPWAAAFLFAALATDFFLGRVFGMYTRPQDGVALAFLLIGAAAAAWLARRHAIAMLLAGAVLASAFAAVQHAEYQERHGEDVVIASRRALR